MEDMASYLTDVDPAFHGAGRREGLEIWRIEDFKPVPVPRAYYGKFFIGDSYIVLKTTGSISFRYDLHYWIGRKSTQDEAGTAAMKAVELDHILGGRAVQYRELQGKESMKFRSYFKPYMVPLPGGHKSGFRHVTVNQHEHITRLYMCSGSGHEIHVRELPLERSSLNHDDIFILDTMEKIYQFNGRTSSIQERGRAFEVVQYLRATFHHGTGDVVRVMDTETIEDDDAAEFWEQLGGFGPIADNAQSENPGADEYSTARLFRFSEGKLEPVDAEVLSQDLLQSNSFYLLDCGIEIYMWIGRHAPIEEKKKVTHAAEELLHDPKHKHAHLIRVIEGHEDLMFKESFNKWQNSREINCKARSEKRA